MDEPESRIGTQLRDIGVEQLTLSSLWDSWPTMADATIEELANRGVPFTAEPVREWVGDPSKLSHMGADFLRASKVGLIERAGFQAASRAERHGSVVAVCGEEGRRHERRCKWGWWGGEVVGDGFHGVGGAS